MYTTIQNGKKVCDTIANENGNIAYLGFANFMKEIGGRVRVS